MTEIAVAGRTNMTFRTLFLLSTLILSACGDGNGTRHNSENNSIDSPSGAASTTVDTNSGNDTAHLAGLWNFLYFSEHTRNRQSNWAYFDIMANGEITVFEYAGESTGNCYFISSLSLSKKSKNNYILLNSDSEIIAEHELIIADDVLYGVYFESAVIDSTVNDRDPVSWYGKRVLGLSTTDFNNCE